MVLEPECKESGGENRMINLPVVEKRAKKRGKEDGKTAIFLFDKKREERAAKRTVASGGGAREKRTNRDEVGGRRGRWGKRRPRGCRQRRGRQGKKRTKEVESREQGKREEADHRAKGARKGRPGQTKL
jgi:hypothetical protein